MGMQRNTVRQEATAQSLDTVLCCVVRAEAVHDIYKLHEPSAHTCVQCIAWIRVNRVLHLHSRHV